MTYKDKLELAKDVLTAVEADLLDATTGEFKPQPDIKDDVAVAEAVVAAYKAHGGVVNPTADKAMAAIAALVQVLGL